jgi:N-acetylmuramoyl-L-alanine amidase
MQEKVGSQARQGVSARLCRPFSSKPIRCEFSSARLSRHADSGILNIVRHIYFLFFFILIVLYARTSQAAGQASSPPQVAVSPQTPASPAQSSAQTAPPQPTQQPAKTVPEPSTPPVTPQRNSLAVVVLDPAHGGADQGARGLSGIAESEIVLGFARLLRISLEGQGLRVVLTRQLNDDPSFDDRSKTANAQRGAIFITLHVSSTGEPGTARVYWLPRDAGVPVSGGIGLPRTGLVRWDRAQQGYIDLSRKLAELIQIQMAQRFRGSAETPTAAAVRQLRTVAAPAVAIEVSSVSLPDRTQLDKMAPALAEGVARAVAAFRLVYESGAK